MPPNKVIIFQQVRLGLRFWRLFSIFFQLLGLELLHSGELARGVCATTELLVHTGKQIAFFGVGRIFGNGSFEWVHGFGGFVLLDQDFADCRQ